MLRHQFRLIFGLDLLLRMGDPLLLCGMVGPRFRLKGSRAVLEELLLPAVEDRGLESLFVAQLRIRRRGMSVGSAGATAPPRAMGGKISQTLPLAAEKFISNQ